MLRLDEQLYLFHDYLYLSSGFSPSRSLGGKYLFEHKKVASIQALWTSILHFVISFDLCLFQMQLMLEAMNALHDKVWSLFLYQTLLRNYQYSVIHLSIQVSRKKKRKWKVDLYCFSKSLWHYSISSPRLCPFYMINLRSLFTRFRERKHQPSL